MVSRKVIYPFLLRHLDDLCHLRPVGEGDGVAFGCLGQQLFKEGLGLRLEQVFPLVLVGRVEEEFRVYDPKVLALLVDAALP